MLVQLTLTYENRQHRFSFGYNVRFIIKSQLNGTIRLLNCHVVANVRAHKSLCKSYIVFVILFPNCQKMYDIYYFAKLRTETCDKQIFH